MKNPEINQLGDIEPHIEGGHLAFKKVEKRPGVMVYVFKNVAVAIDTSGKNSKELPELLFGTYDGVLDNTAVNKPEEKRENIDMDLVLDCIKEVVKESGINKFWMFPFGADNPGDEEKRRQARLRLFKRYFNITPDPKGFGYIMEIN